MKHWLSIALYQINIGELRPTITSAKIEATHLAVPQYSKTLLARANTEQRIFPSTLLQVALMSIVNQTYTRNIQVYSL